MGIAAEIIPKGVINLGQSLSRPPGDSSFYTREPLGTGDADRRVASLLAMTVLILCHSEEAQRADVGIRPFYDGRGFGPPRSSAPTEGLPKSQQRADIPKVWLPPTKFHAEIWGVGQVVGPYGKPKPAGAQRSARASVGEGWAGIDARTIPKRGPPPRPPRQRLAKRKARKEQLVKFGLCPMASECSTAYEVRRSQQSPARALVGIALTEQDRLEPRPAARQGALRARNCAAIKRFFF